MAVTKDKDYLPPHWTSDGGVKRCSICGHPFPKETISIDKAFKEHFAQAHKPGQKTEDSSQAALRVVREATENK
ncbi:MAG: hypothetical protein WCC25_19110 [Candidatus Korobacteraceae bacterium]